MFSSFMRNVTLNCVSNGFINLANTVFVFILFQILTCYPVFGQLQEQQLTLEDELDSCIWNLNIEQVSKEEFTKAYNRSAPYNGRIDSITDAQLNRELIGMCGKDV